MTGTSFHDAAMLIDQVAQSTGLEALVAAAAPKAGDLQQNLRKLSGALRRSPPVITADEARGQLDLLIFSATGPLAPLAGKLQAARDALTPG